MCIAGAIDEPVVKTASLMVLMSMKQTGTTTTPTTTKLTTTTPTTKTTTTLLPAFDSIVVSTWINPPYTFANISPKRQNIRGVAAKKKPAEMVDSLSKRTKRDKPVDTTDDEIITATTTSTVAVVISQLPIGNLSTQQEFCHFNNKFVNASSHKDEHPNNTWLQEENSDTCIFQRSNTSQTFTFALHEEQILYEDLESVTCSIEQDKSSSLIDYHGRSISTEQWNPESNQSHHSVTNSSEQKLATPEPRNHVDEFFDFPSSLLGDDELSCSLLQEPVTPTSEEPATFREMPLSFDQERQPISKEEATCGKKGDDVIRSTRNSKNLQIKRKGKTKRISRNNSSGKKTRSKRESGPKIWQFIIQLLHDRKHSHIITWLDSEGKFKFLAPKKFAELWAKRNGKEKNIIYNNVARSMRYWYKTGYLEPVRKDNHIYRMGPKSMEYINKYYGSLHQQEQWRQADRWKQPHLWGQPDDWDPPNKFGDRDGDWRPCTQT